MNMPGFNAEASLHKTSGRYRSLESTGLIGYPLTSAQLPPFPPPPVNPPIDLCQIDPRFCPPSVNASWQPPAPGDIRGSLTVFGGGFPPSTPVAVTIINCDAFPVRQFVTTNPALGCTPLGCSQFFGGDFQLTVPCFCGGVATVIADDGRLLGDVASGTAQIPC
jgi:hypothetical protein